MSFSCLRAGAVLRTAARGGIQIESPGGTVLVITPGWWDHYELWYLNVDVRQARATDGVMGAIAHGSWLPALPDGTSLGPQPRDLNQRYQDLYVTFANAWRVTAATSLFDYAPGGSPSTFAIANWPGQAPSSCLLPPGAGRLADIAPPRSLPLDAAQKLCAGIVTADVRTNCEQDVMVTGDAGFARTYLMTEQLARNTVPGDPVLTFPDDFTADLVGRVRFAWERAMDADGDALTYRHCVWEEPVTFTFASCAAVSGGTPLWPAELTPAVRLR